MDNECIIEETETFKITENDDVIYLGAGSQILQKFSEAVQKEEKTQSGFDSYTQYILNRGKDFQTSDMDSSAQRKPTKPKNQTRYSYAQYIYERSRNDSDEEILNTHAEALEAADQDLQFPADK